MSRFVRASKYRHVYGQTAKKEHTIENVKVTNSAWDTNVVSASGSYLSINWNASGGGAFAIIPLPSPFGPITQDSSSSPFPQKLPDSLPLARSHTAPVLDTDWSPHNDNTVASAGEDGKIMLWSVSPSAFVDWNTEGWIPRDFDPVLRIDASPRKIGQLAWHPTAQGVLASASGEHVIKLWDISSPEDAQVVLQGHSDTIQSLAWSPSGHLLATTSRDRKLRLYDPRASTSPVRTTDGHGGVKGTRAVFMGDTGRLATTGFSKMSDRQVSVWELGNLDNIKTVTIDQSAGVIMPFWSDNGLLFLAGKGDGNVRYYEYESDSLFALSEYSSSQPQRGMTFLPRRALSITDCEIARAYKVASSSIEPIAFIVPRKADSFQADIFPPAPSLEPSLSASQYFSSNTPIVQKLVNLETGKIVQGGSGAWVPPPTPASAAPTPVTPTPPSATKSFSAPPPEPAAAPPPSITRAESLNVTLNVSNNTQSNDELDALRAENQQLNLALNHTNEELREARALIRNLELQVETIKANAKKAAQQLLEGA